MENSQLVAIIKRLDAMSNNEGNEVSSRRFEKDGEERGFVTFDPATKTYTLEEIASKQNLNSTILILLQWKSTICLMTNS